MAATVSSVAVLVAVKPPQKKKPVRISSRNPWPPSHPFINSVAAEGEQVSLFSRAMRDG